MKDKIVEFLNLIPRSTEQISKKEIFALFLENDQLSSSRGDIYFIVSLTKILKILKPIKKSLFVIDWPEFDSVKKKWGFE